MQVDLRQLQLALEAQPAAAAARSSAAPAAYKPLLEKLVATGKKV